MESKAKTMTMLVNKKLKYLVSFVHLHIKVSQVFQLQCATFGGFEFNHCKQALIDHLELRLPKCYLSIQFQQYTYIRTQGPWPFQSLKHLYDHLMSEQYARAGLGSNMLFLNLDVPEICGKIA